MKLWLGLLAPLIIRFLDGKKDGTNLFRIEGTASYSIYSTYCVLSLTGRL